MDLDLDKTCHKERLPAWSKRSVAISRNRQSALRRAQPAKTILFVTEITNQARIIIGHIQSPLQEKRDTAAKAKVNESSPEKTSQGRNKIRAMAALAA